MYDASSLKLEEASFNVFCLPTDWRISDCSTRNALSLSIGTIFFHTWTADSKLKGIVYDESWWYLFLMAPEPRLRLQNERVNLLRWEGHAFSLRATAYILMLLKTSRLNRQPDRPRPPYLALVNPEQIFESRHLGLFGIPTKAEYDVWSPWLLRT